LTMAGMRAGRYGYRKFSVTHNSTPKNSDFVAPRIMMKLNLKPEGIN